MVDAKDIISLLGATINHQVNEYLRYLSDLHIVTLQKRIEELRDRNNFGYFFVTVIVMLFLATIVEAALHRFFPNFNIYSSYAFSWTFLIGGFLIPWLLAASKMKLSLQEIGITTKKLRKSMVEGLIFSCLAVLFLFGIVLLIDPLIPEKTLTENFLNLYFPLAKIPYLFHSFIQEALRAVIQISIQKFFRDAHWLYSVSITAVIFGMCHAHFGIDAILMTLIASILFGAIYIRTYNIFGVTLFHFVVGFLVFQIGLL